jgi:hypothetical protein
MQALLRAALRRAGTVRGVDGDTPLAEILTAIRGEITRACADRRAHPTLSALEVATRRAVARDAADLAGALSDDTDDGGVGEMPVPRYPHETLRVFPRLPLAPAPVNCRLCDSGWVTHAAFAKHLVDRHGGELLYRARLQYLLDQEGPQPIGGQRMRATVEEGAYRYRTGEREWPKPRGTHIITPGDCARRRRAACAVCATEAWHADLERRKWPELAKGDEHARAVEGLLSVEAYMEWCRSHGLLFPEPEVRRAAVRLGRSGAHVVLHKRAAGGPGALAGPMQCRVRVRDRKYP